jgi:hypothetical protein
MGWRWRVSSLLYYQKWGPGVFEPPFLIALESLLALAAAVLVADDKSLVQLV